ncbi:MAG: hypothetical protein AAF927_30220 [Bacteroidota bacterium]
MAKKQLSELSMSELQNKFKQMKNVQFVVLALVILYGAFMIYQMFSGSFDLKVPQISVPVAIVFLSIALNKRQKEVQAEIDKRQSA